MEIALEQAEMVVEDRNYDEWSRAAYISANVLNASGSKKKYKPVDLIGEHPQKEREKKKKQKRIEGSKEELRQLALDKGLDVTF